MNLADNLTFGIEIEAVFPAGTFTNVGHYHRGIRQGSEWLNWEAQSDSSIRSGYGEQGVEIVSPVLRGLEGLLQVQYIANKIQEVGGKVNESCGIHVHVGLNEVMAGMFWEESSTFIQKILVQHSTFENALFGIGNRISRLNNTYCRSVKRFWNDSMAKSVTKDRYGFNSKVQNDTRYQTLNLQHLFTRGTVEFRIFAATLNPVKLVGYVVTAMGIVERASEVSRAGKFNEVSATKRGNYYYEVMVLHARLNWERTRKDSGRCGFPTGAFEVFGKAVMKNQRHQSKRFDERLGNESGR